MRIKLDRRNDKLFIDFTEFDDADVAHTELVYGYFSSGVGKPTLLFNEGGKLLGIEVEYASHAMTEDFMRAVRDGDIPSAEVV
jgi:hypothetical protein